MEREQAHHACFLAGGKSLHCAGCSVTPLLVVPRLWVMSCILHCTMAICGPQQDFIRKELEGLSAADKIRLKGNLADHNRGCSIFHSRSPDRGAVEGFVRCMARASAPAQGVWGGCGHRVAVAGFV